jgi:hypothetical protein
MTERALAPTRLEMAYLGVEVSDLGATTRFNQDLLGLEASGAREGYPSSWRVDLAPYRLLAREGPSDDIAVLGIEAADESVFEEVVNMVEASGTATAEADDAACKGRQVRRMARMIAPWGTPIELVLGFERLAEEPVLDGVPGGFLTHGVGFGHLVLEVEGGQFEASRRFLEQGIGLVRSDSLTMDTGDGQMRGVFYHCNPRHHSLALGTPPAGAPPRRLHHMMLEAREVDGVVSFYAVGPAGYQVEVGWGAVQITDPWDGDHVYDRGSRWGHKPHE